MTQEQKPAFSKEFLSQFKNMDEIEAYMSSLKKAAIESMLDGELDAHLGYEYYQRPEEKSEANYRNGKRKKTVKTTSGTLDIEVPIDRTGSFEPQVIKKRQRIIDELEDRILSLYAKGMSVRDIEEQMHEIYGVSVSASVVSRVTDKVLDTIRLWQQRPLEETYPVIWMDGIRFKVKTERGYKAKVIYLVIGLNLQGHKEVLGIWLDETESAAFWMKVLDDMKHRGVKRVFIAATDNLTGFGQAIQAVFPECLQQICLVHQVRNSLKNVIWADRKELAADLKTIYTATDRVEAEENLLKVEEKWGGKYPHIFKSWTENWEKLTVFFGYPAEIRRLIYTTNVIENLNRVLRKYTKGKTIFPSDEAVQKSIFLAVEHISKKWSMPVANWPLILSQFAILYPDQIKLQL
jgi:transposase-like protein